MNIKIVKDNGITTVHTVDGVFKFKELEKDDKVFSLEEETSISIETLLSNLFTITQADKNLLLTVENK